MSKFMVPKSMCEKKEKIVFKSSIIKKATLCLLVSAGVTSMFGADNTTGKELIEAAKNGNLLKFRECLSNGVDPNTKDKDGNTSLIAGAKYGYIDRSMPSRIGIVKELLGIPKLKCLALRVIKNNNIDISWLPEGLRENVHFGHYFTPPDINAQDKYGDTALMWAACWGYTEIVRLLLEARADMDRSDGCGYTPLIRAANNGHTEIVRLLLEAQVDINAKNQFGYTGFVNAFNNGYMETAKFLKDQGANIKSAHLNDGIWLMHACRSGNLEILKQIIQIGIDVNKKDQFGYTPLLVVSLKGDKHKEMLKVLQDAGAKM